MLRNDLFCLLSDVRLVYGSCTDVRMVYGCTARVRVYGSCTDGVRVYGSCTGVRFGIYFLGMLARTKFLPAGNVNLNSSHTRAVRQPCVFFSLTGRVNLRLIW